MGRVHGDGYDDEDQALESAQELANHRSENMFVMRDGERIGGARPTVDEDGIAGEYYQGSGTGSTIGSDNNISPMGSGTNEDQYGGGFGGGSVAPVTDTTSPIHGYGEGKDDEADYDDDYQDTVRRIKQKAKELEHGIKTVWVPNPHGTGGHYKVVPNNDRKTTNEDAQQSISPSSRELIRVARQSNPEATSDQDAIYGYLNNISKKTQDNYKQVNNILQQLDPLSSELDQAEQNLDNVENVSRTQQDVLRRLNHRLDQVRTQTLPSQQRAKGQDHSTATDPTISKELDTIKSKLDKTEPDGKQAQPVQQQEPAPQQATSPEIDNLKQEIGDLRNQITNNNDPSSQEYLQRLEAEKTAILSRLVQDMGNTPTQQDSQDQADNVYTITNQLRGNQQPELFNEAEMMESRLYQMKLAGYDIL
jgi:hypothetical protein